LGVGIETRVVHKGLCQCAGFVIRDTMESAGGGVDPTSVLIADKQGT
jgi:hypothetical protein